MSTDPKLRQRVITIDKFASERRSGHKLTPGESKAKYGTKYTPIPVPLALGETAEQYEAAFRASTATRIGRPFSDIQSEWGVEKERTIRYIFANHRLKKFKAKHGDWEPEPPSQDTFVDDFEMPARHGTKRETPQDATSITRKEPERDGSQESYQRRRNMELYTKRYVDLYEHQEELRAGLFHRIKAVTAEEKEREFGSHVVPIFVPLARGETKQQYEERFKDWIWRKHRRTLDELEKHPSATQERHYRMLFAQANTFGQAKFVPPVSEPKRDREKVEDEQREEWPHKKHKEEESRRENEMPLVETKVETTVHSSRKEPCTGHESISSKIACGCRQCLVSGMRSLATTITEVDTLTREKRKSSHGRAADVVDLTSDSESATYISGRRHRLKPHAHVPSKQDDPIQDQLMNSYNAINEQIVMNEKVLESSAIRLASTPVDDIKETTHIQDEDQEMRELIQDEMAKRSVAVAMLIVYMWREEISGLKEMVSDPDASNVIFVQRASHHKLAMLAMETATKKRVITDFNAQLAAVPVDDSREENEKLLVKLILTAMRSDLTTEFIQLESQQKLQLVNLVYFDELIRQSIQALLAQV